MAESMSSISSLPPLADDDKFTFINKKICDTVIPEVFSTVIGWGCDKPQHRSYLDHIKLKTNLSDKEWKQYTTKYWLKNEILKLKENSTDGFDTTLMFKLIPEVCNNVERFGAIASKGRDESRLEWLLKILKDIRNDVMHDPKGGAVAKEIADEVLRVSEQILTLSAIKFSKPGCVAGTFSAADEVIRIKTKVLDIKQLLMTTREKRLWGVRLKILNDGLQELKDMNEQQRIENFLSPGYMNNMYPLNLSTFTDTGHKLTFSSQSLLKQITELFPAIKIFIVEGHSGSGKSTLVNQMKRDVLCGSKEKEFFHNSHLFQIPVFVPCRAHTQESLKRFLKRLFSKSALSIDEDDLEDALQLLSSIFLVDGADEWNSKSEVLVHDVVNYVMSHPSAICIVTARPHSAQHFRSFLNKAGFCHQTFQIQLLSTSEGQVQFLRHSGDDGGLALSNMYKKLNMNLEYPIHLSLFSYFYFKDPERVKLWTTESHVMRGTVECCKTDALQRLQQKQVRNGNALTKKVLSNVAVVSFYCLLMDKLSVADNVYDILNEKCIKDCRKLASSEVDFDEILSCFFKCLYSKEESHKVVTYEYYHKTHQEILSSLFLCKEIVNFRRDMTDICKVAIEKLIPNSPPDDILSSANIKKFLSR